MGLKTVNWSSGQVVNWAKQGFWDERPQGERKKDIVPDVVTI